MGTGIDGQADDLIAAIATLAGGALAADLGASILDGVYRDPRTLQTLASGKLPALCVYRLSEVRRREDSTSLVRDVDVVFDYVLPSTSLDKRDKRIPALQAVWNLIADTMAAGHHAAVEDNAAVLDEVCAGVLDERMRVEYGFAEGGSELYPFLRGRIIVAHSPDPDWSAMDLHPFKRFYGVFTDPGNTDSDFTEPVDPDRLRIDLNLTLEGYSPWPPST